MTTATSLVLLLGVGVSVALSFCCWRGLRALSELAGRELPPIEASRLARLLLTGSLLIAMLLPATSPSLASWFDGLHLSASGMPTAELPGADVSASAPAAKAPTDLSPAPIGVVAEPPWMTLTRIHGQALIVVLCWLLATGWALSAASFLVKWRVLHEVVRRAVRLRRIGGVTVAVSDQVSVPFATRAFGRADVVLPVSVLGRSHDLRLALRHELQHHRRGDGWWSCGLELLRIVFFWNPVMRSWSNELAELQELACDAEVLAQGVDRKHYADCMLRIADEAVPGPAFAVAAMSPAGDQLKRRLAGVLGGAPLAAVGVLRVAAVLMMSALGTGAWFVGQAWAERPAGESFEVESNAEVVALHEELVSLRERLLPPGQDSKPITKLNELARRSRVKITRISSRRPVQEQYHDSHSLTLNLEGSLRDVGLFFSRISRLPRPIAVKRMTIRTSEEPASTDPGYVSVKVRLAAYSHRVSEPSLAKREPSRFAAERSELTSRLAQGEMSEAEYIDASAQVTKDVAAWLRAASADTATPAVDAEEVRVLRGLLERDDRPVRFLQFATSGSRLDGLTLGEEGITGRATFDDPLELSRAVKEMGSDLIESMAMTKDPDTGGTRVLFGAATR